MYTPCIKGQEDPIVKKLEEKKKDFFERRLLHIQNPPLKDSVAVGCMYTHLLMRMATTQMARKDRELGHDSIFAAVVAVADTCSRERCIYKTIGI